MVENKLQSYIDDFFNGLQLYDDKHNGHYYADLLKAVIDVFLENENEKNATEVYETFFMIYQITSEDKSEVGKNKSFISDNEPNTLLDLVQLMKTYETNTGQLIDKQRDHFIHSVNVFILGLAIYSQNETYRQLFKEYVIDSPYKKYYRFKDVEEIEESEKIEKIKDVQKISEIKRIKHITDVSPENVSDEEFLYRWGIAALFHDIGYPIEIIGKQMKKFVKDGIKSISVNYNVETAIEFKDFDEFNTIRKINPSFADKYREDNPESKFLNLFKPTDIMAHKISSDFNKIDINQLINHLNSFFEIMGNNGFIDHGFFSSILVLNSYGFLIQKHENKIPDFFFYPIVDSATAILLHNYYGNVLRKKPFELPVLSPQDSPLAFLLILCDELQEWNRQPYGSEDKKRNHVNELEIDISGDHIYVDYILKAGSLGLGFSQDKESFLYNVLAIKNIFNRGLAVNTRVDGEEDFIHILEKQEIYSPYVLMKNIELLAKEVHNDYRKQAEESDEEVDEESMKEYKDLSPGFKLSNVQSAKSIPTKLNMIGCEIAPIQTGRENGCEAEEKEYEKEYIITDAEVEELSIFEHKRWCEERLNNGWKWGEETIKPKKIHKSLVEWEELPESEKEKDRNSIRAIPRILKTIGMKVVKSKLKLLAHEKHNYYRKDNDVEKFEDLPSDIQFLNYKQTYFMVKVLKEMGLNVVSIDHSGEAIEFLNKKQVKYLAVRDHESWCKNKLNMAYRYDSSKGKYTNPNIKPWKELDKTTRDLNKRTYEQLPKLCENVGLKIVKME